MSLKKLHNTFKTSTALLVGQVLNFILIPLISRTYSPHVFSIWALYLTVVTIIGGVSTARYSDSLVLIRSKKNASAMLSLCLCIGIGFSILSVLLMPIFYFYLKMPWYGLLLMPINILLMSAHLSFTQTLVRQGKFVFYSVALFAMSVLPGLCQFVGGHLFGKTGEVIVGAGFVGQCFSSFLTFKFSNTRVQIHSVKKLKAMARHYSRFPKYSLGFAFFSLLRVRFIYLIFGAYKDSSFLGNFAQADRLVNAPSTLLGASIRPVFFRYAASVGMHNVERQLTAILKNLLLIGAPVVGVIMFFSEEIVHFVLGKQWTGASWIFKTMLVPSFLLFCTNWLDRAYDVLKSQKIVFLFEVFYGLMALTVVSVAILIFANPYAAINGVAVVFTIYYTHWVLALFHKMKAKIAPIFGYIIGSLCIIIGTTFFLEITKSSGFNLTGGVVLILTVHAIFVYFSLRKDWSTLWSISRI